MRKFITGALLGILACFLMGSQNVLDDLNLCSQCGLLVNGSTAVDSTRHAYLTQGDFSTGVTLAGGTLLANYVESALTPTWSGLTQTGSVTITARDTRIGREVFLEIRIAPGVGGLVVFDNTTTMTNLPYVSGAPGTGEIIDGTVNVSIGQAWVDTGSSTMNINGSSGGSDIVLMDLRYSV